MSSRDSALVEVQGQWARLLIGGLVELGASDFVVSPGSRSTPLVLALLLVEKQSSKEIRIHSVLDERAAAFLALGLARATGRASVLICTSGTAPAHYFPAVIEAHEAGLPLVVVSADRPPELQQTKAPQTIAQQSLFGSHVLQSLDLGTAVERRGAFAAMARKVSALWALAHGSKPGPVHLNVPLYKPLESPLAGAPSSTVSAEVAQILAAFPRMTLPAPELESASSLVWEKLQAAKAPLVVLGEGGHSFACALAPHLPLPIVGEARASGFGVPDVDILLRATAGKLQPDFVLQIGQSLCSARYSEWLGRSSVETWLVSAEAEFEPAHRATRCIVADPAAFGQALGRRARPVSHQEGWNRAFRACVQELHVRVPGAIVRTAPSASGLAEPRTVERLLELLPDKSTLMVGNSMPLRLVNWIIGSARQKRPLDVVVQRGVNGIDGLIAGAIGLARVPAPGPVTLLLGDVSAAHDLSSLLFARDLARPLLIVVLDNNGGHIFDQLPLGRDRPERYDLWSTPPRVDFSAVSLAYGHTAATVETYDELEWVVERAIVGEAPARCHVAVVRCNAASTTLFLAALDRDPKPLEV